MGWTRMLSESERRKQQAVARKPQERIAGFFPLSPGMQLVGTLEAIKVKDTGKGFYLIRTKEPCVVNVREDDSSPTGRGVANPGDIVGIRKTGATKCLSELPLKTLVMVTYNALIEKESYNPNTKQMEAAPFHDITIDVYSPDVEMKAA